MRSHLGEPACANGGSRAWHEVERSNRRIEPGSVCLSLCVRVRAANLRRRIGCACSASLCSRSREGAQRRRAVRSGASTGNTLLQVRGTCAQRTIRVTAAAVGNRARGPRSETCDQALSLVLDSGRSRTRSPSGSRAPERSEGCRRRRHKLMREQSHAARLARLKLLTGSALRLGSGRCARRRSVKRCRRD